VSLWPFFGAKAMNGILGLGALIEIMASRMENKYTKRVLFQDEKIDSPKMRHFPSGPATIQTLDPFAADQPTFSKDIWPG
jgi:hypothetical protein